MNWTPQQDAALKAVSRWLRDSDQQVFRLFGYAGTGKTTMAKALADDVAGQVLFGAYTGKAALVLRQRGCPGASTLHGLAYTTKDRSKSRLKELEQQLAERLREVYLDNKDDEDLFIQEAQDNDREVRRLRTELASEKSQQGRPLFALNHESPIKGASLLVVDECSMVDEAMGSDLLSFGTKVLVLGDPAQLPPVRGGGFFTECQPDIMLTDIQRQAKDNPIIRLATMVREERMPDLGTYGSTRVVERVDADIAMRADQVLVGRNATRFATNQRIRTLLGRADWRPVSGDRLVCLRNNHDLGLLNGAIWQCVGADDADDKVSLSIFDEDANVTQDVIGHTHHFEGRSDQLPWYERKDAEEFDYGYALTVHKSQGSQWRNVMLFNEGGAFRQDRWRWLYTGITRASEQLTLVHTT